MKTREVIVYVTVAVLIILAVLIITTKPFETEGIITTSSGPSERISQSGNLEPSLGPSIPRVLSCKAQRGKDMVWCGSNYGEKAKNPDPVKFACCIEDSWTLNRHCRSSLATNQLESSC